MQLRDKKIALITDAINRKKADYLTKLQELLFNNKLVEEKIIKKMENDKLPKIDVAKVTHKNIAKLKSE